MPFNRYIINGSHQVWSQSCAFGAVSKVLCKRIVVCVQGQLGELKSRPAIEAESCQVKTLRMERESLQHPSDRMARTGRKGECAQAMYRRTSSLCISQRGLW